MDINDALKCADDPESNSVVETTLATAVRRLSAELERLREQKPFGYMSAENKDSHPDGVYVKREPWKTQTNIPLFAAANPAAVMELIAEMDRLRDEANGMTGTIARISTEFVNDQRGGLTENALVAKLQDPAVVYMAMLRGEIAKITWRQMVHLSGPVPNTADEALAEIVRLRAEVKQLNVIISRLAQEGQDAVEM